MGEYIEKQKAVDLVREKVGKYRAFNDGFISDILKTAALQINLISAADVAPVVHAEWIPIWEEGETFEGFTEKFVESFQCSSCGNYAVPDSPYCPHCGAKMDAEAP